MKNDTLGLYGPEDSRYLRLVAHRVADVVHDRQGGRGLHPVHGAVLLC